MTTWDEYHQAVARIAAEMLGAAEYLDEHPEFATDERRAEVFREYVEKLRAVERPAVNAYRDSLRPEQLPAYDAAIKKAGEVLAASDMAQAQMTPREQAEAAWTPTTPYLSPYQSIDELEDAIRAERGLSPREEPPSHVIPEL